MTPPPRDAAPAPGLTGAMRFPEFVTFIAACMALNALAIDVMLPALPLLTADFGLTDPNQAQAVIFTYLIGMGGSQLFYGPLSDRYGRRPVLIGGLMVFALAGLLSALTTSFSTLLAARLLQGIGAGAPRVVAVSLARDTYSGAQMGRVMSLAMMVFMAVPILAPSVGQLIMLVAPWRWAFGALVLAGTGVLAWTLLRLQESLPEARRQPISPRAVLAAFRTTVTTRVAAGYMLALGMVVGAHMGFITSAQQIFVDVFDAGRSFTLLCALVALNLLHVALALGGLVNLPVFVLMQAGSMFVFGFLAANLNTMAMEPLGHIAGTASSAIGFFTTCCGALIGFGIGQLFDGSVLPLTASYVVLGLLALGVVLVTERPLAQPACA
jgi:DHA1 family bicyclomycin/chloramphenicol resistance-like MFS transporter